MIGLFGSAGFIGRNMIDHLSAQGVPFRAFSRRPVHGNSRDTILIDFARPETYLPHLDGLTAAVLLVSGSVPGTYANDLPSEIEKNVLPYSRFLKAIEQSAIDRLIYVSSGGTVYGVPQTDPIDETHPTNPISSYGCAKLMIETIIKAEAINAPWSYTILRPSNPIGPYQTSSKGQGLVARVVQSCLAGRTMEVWGDGSAVRDYFDVRDLCNAITITLSSEEARNSVFNVGSGIGRSVVQIIAAVREILNCDLPITYKEGRALDVNRNVLETRRLSTLGWKPHYDLESSIRATLESHEDN